jgi:beta-catenin-like protein 1
LSLLDESRDDEKQGVFQVLSILENSVAIIPSLSATICTIFTPWLVTRMEIGKGFDSVRGYVAEILSILLSNHKENRIRCVELGGLDTLLQILAYYRKRDPRDGDELEMVENIFDVVAGIVQEHELHTRFLDAEGIQLMLIMVK